MFIAVLFTIAKIWNQHKCLSLFFNINNLKIFVEFVCCHLGSMELLFGTNSRQKTEKNTFSSGNTISLIHAVAHQRQNKIKTIFQ